MREPVAFRDEEHLRQVIDRVVSSVGRRVDESSPMVDARLADGSRVNAVLPPVALDGPLLTIRKFGRRPIGVADMIASGSLTRGQAELLERCVRGRLNVVVSGGTGTGKTTLLNALAGFIDPSERIVTVEDAAELRLPQPHVARLESRPPNVEGRGEVTLRALVRNALRMRPDRIVVGEVRGGEALDMLQAMNTGHDGSLTTVHASSPADAVRRIETMALMAGLDLPHVAVREQVAAAVDVIVHLVREGDGSRRVRFVDGRGRDGRLQMLDVRLLAALLEHRCHTTALIHATGEALVRRRRERLQAAQLAVVVEILAAHVRAGRSLRQALADAVADVPEPAAGRVAEAAADAALGAPPDDGAASARRRAATWHTWPRRCACTRARAVISRCCSSGWPSSCTSGPLSGGRRRWRPRRRVPPAGSSRRCPPSVSRRSTWSTDRASTCSCDRRSAGWRWPGRPAWPRLGHALITRLSEVEP